MTSAHGFTDKDCDRIARDIFSRMKKAGWLLGYRFTEGKGWWLDWVSHGAEASNTLKQWGQLLHLAEDADSGPVLAYELAHGKSLLIADRAAKETQTLLDRYVEAGFATRAVITPDGRGDIAWTSAGLDFCDRFNAITSELGIGADPDTLIMLFAIADDWAPGPDTPLRSVSDN